MTEAIIQINMLTEWLIGGERDRSSWADVAQVRDRFGLPYIPGRSLRGLLRDASHTLCMSSSAMHKDTHVKLFGAEGIPGELRVGNAYLPDVVRNQCLQYKEQELELRDFVTLVAATAIDPESGSAKKHSLRFTEVAIPGLQLEASISLPESYLIAMATICAMVRCLGANRYRGLGRCYLKLCHDSNPQPIDYLSVLQKENV